MSLLKKLRPALAILGLMAFSAVCAMAQAEINPDHFDDTPQQAPAMHTAHTQHAASPAVTHSSQRTAQIQGQAGSTVAGKSAAHEGSATGAETVSRPDSVKHGNVRKRHKKLLSEDRRYGMP
jgi:hypothetical protein